MIPRNPPANASTVRKEVDEGKPKINHSLKALSTEAPEKEVSCVMEVMLTINKIKPALAPCAYGSTVDEQTLYFK